MGLRWLLLLVVIWDSASGLEDAVNTANQSATSEAGPTPPQPTSPHLKTKRGASYVDWASKQYGLRNTKKIPKFSSWGGKRNAPPLQPCVGDHCLLDESDYFDPNEKETLKGELEWSEEQSDSTDEQKAAEFDKRNADRLVYRWAPVRRLQDSFKRNRFSSWGGKRNNGWEVDAAWDGQYPEYDTKRAKFSSWGGKRSVIDEEKRTRFSSWGGKRSDIDDQSEEKRAQFASWGGKRSDNGLNVNKRARFSSWGGKRSETDNMIEEKRAKFSSWGGKRSEADDPKEEKRDRFSSWGGKRSEIDESAPDKRAKFSSWGGKRSDTEDLNVGEKRAKFSSWGGKRSDDNEPNEEKRAKFSSWGGKRSDINEPNEGKRAMFSSWGGKRNEIEDQSEDKRTKFSSWGGKRGEPDEKRTRFSSWGGKRSEEGLENLCRNLKEYESPAKRDSGFFLSRGYGGGANWKRKPIFSSWGGKRSLPEEGGLWKLCERLMEGDQPELEKRAREPLGGKRRTPFSSWGGKRSHTLTKRSAEPSVTGERSAKKSIIGRYYMKNILLKDGAGWSSALRPIRRGSDFYPWGGKRSLPS